MPREREEVVPLLERDVSRTVGETYRSLVRDVAANVRELDREDFGDKVVEDVQQYFHDCFVDTTWPACPRHETHPLWYRDGAWWCERDKVAISRLGELAAR
jgi:hypothetical protein